MCSFASACAPCCRVVFHRTSLALTGISFGPRSQPNTPLSVPLPLSVHCLLHSCLSHGLQHCLGLRGYGRTWSGCVSGEWSAAVSYGSNSCWLSVIVDIPSLLHHHHHHHHRHHTFTTTTIITTTTGATAFTPPPPPASSLPLGSNQRHTRQSAASLMFRLIDGLCYFEFAGPWCSQ